MPSLASWRSTIICVAMPAWSVPGSHSVAKPRMRCQRAMMSICVWLSMCPMCRRPVTLGGGSCMQKTGLPGPTADVGTSNRRSFTQHSAQRASMALGS